MPMNPRRRSVTHDPRTSPAGRQPSLLHDVELGARNKSMLLTIADRTEAIGWLLRSAEEGDCVLVAGGTPRLSGHGEESDDRASDDRAIVRRFLKDGVLVGAAGRAAA